MPDAEPIYQAPKLLGCFLSLIWLAMLPLAVLFFAAGYISLDQGFKQGETPLRQLGWWLIAAGGACSVILCCSIIISMRIRQLSKESWLEEDPSDKADLDEAEDAQINH